MAAVRQAVDSAVGAHDRPGSQKPDTGDDLRATSARIPHPARRGSSIDIRVKTVRSDRRSGCCVRALRSCAATHAPDPRIAPITPADSSSRSSHFEVLVIPESLVSRLHYPMRAARCGRRREVHAVDHWWSFCSCCGWSGCRSRLRGGLIHIAAGLRRSSSCLMRVPQRPAG